MDESSARIVEVLLVEDNPGDVRLTQEVLKDGKIRNKLNVVGDGVEALEYLRRQGAYADAAPQDLVLLDLNLPRKSGREVLEEMKADPELRRIPVVVLTTSASEVDVLAAYDLHANCYITKPVDLSQFEAVIRTIEGFWLSIVRLPKVDAE
ncbi:MAG: response regulator [Coriobacteriia bacterium]|nr:response regulator [Coriobacteriia bacterium]